MPRTVPGALATHLDREVTTLCFLYKLTRKDSFVLGFTDHDLALTYDDGSGEATYEPSDGLSGSVVESEVGTGVGNMDVIGVLTDDRITEADVAAGRWDAAELKVYRVNWADLSNGHMVEFKGFLGEIEQGKVAFRAEVRGLGQMLKQVSGVQTTKNCTVKRLGNAQCKVALNGNTVGGTPIRATVSAASDGVGSLITFGPHTVPDAHYSHGICKMTSGPNTGIEREIKLHEQSGSDCAIHLRTPFPYPVSSGETALLEAGCDRTWATCGDKFANRNNYHGFEQLPGNDKILKVGRPPG